ncbi:hypothetical protein LG200_01945 [Methylobacillus caricis]|nr:hypothetical protein [Methylobacillus caricis]MCB5186763.1 hypothetical protein [Methylobacillus caricis]
MAHNPQLRLCHRGKASTIGKYSTRAGSFIHAAIDVGHLEKVSIED